MLMVSVYRIKTRPWLYKPFSVHCIAAPEYCDVHIHMKIVVNVSKHGGEVLTSIH